MLSSPDYGRDIRPIFVIGAPRSGTSITTWVLGQHPNIQLTPETSWIASIAAGGYLSYTYGSGRGRFSHLSNVKLPLEPFMRRLGEFVHSVVNDCFEERCHRRYGPFRETGELRTPLHFDSPEGFDLRLSVDDPKRRWIDATPFNTYFTWALTLMFPEARFLHNLRRPEDVATSLQGFDKFGHVSLELEDGLRTWASHTEHAWLAERWLGADRVFRLDFSRLSSDPAALVGDVLAFLGEEYSEACLAPLRTRINSSEVDDRRAANLEALREHEAFQRCEALHASVNAQPPGRENDAEAGERLRQQFISYCEHHPLI